VSELAGAGADWSRTDRPLATVARNVLTRYAVIIANLVIGLMLLPFNVAHLGPAAYGLWLMTAAVTTYFSVLDLGYGAALVRYVARYRAQGDARGINETASTLFVAYGIFGIVGYLLAWVVSVNMGRLFAIDAEQAAIGGAVLRIVALQFALSLPFHVYGAVINGFQRYDANNLVALGSAIVVAIVNVAVLTAGYGLILLVSATTAVWLIALAIYRRNAYGIFPALQVRPSLASWSRLREVSSFSVYTFIIDAANKLNYSLDPLVIGAVLGSTPVAVWGVAERIIGSTQSLTNQLNTMLFPVVVDSDARANDRRLRRILIEGTRLSLATVLPIAVALVILAGPLIRAWVGPGFEASVIVLQILAIATAIRVGNATATTLLKGSGRHRFIALTNLATAIVNVVLSIALARLLGLPGVALATLAPLAFTATTLQFPTACRCTGVPLRTALATAVWPALWPAIAIVGVLFLTQGLGGDHPRLHVLALRLGLAAVAYYAVFALLAIDDDERRGYLQKAQELWNRRAAPAPAQAQASR
jgi:O-antigen/teichoic acid export membrane protein